ncbi:UNVERIFIED_CONTAM: Beta-glucosidase BoGH3B [Sesamum calycinum]|uniref:Beta-glucosidase BoGH3B n=1 Tax=Sesamum calycinum TaxID=2727403 RepID=A0AAW2PNJ4_9LAMI
MKWVGRVWLLWVWIAVVLCSRRGAVGKEEYMKYKDPKQPVGVRVKDLLGRMSLEEKIGQMVQIDRIAASPDIMKDYYIGSLLSGGGSTPLPRATAADWVNMVNDFQNGSLSTRLGIPMIYGIDAVHGHNNVYNATIFPHNIGLGATRDPELLRRIGDATATEVRATGIPYVFAPCIAVCRDPRWGRCYESYSEDPQVVREMTDIILGLQGEIPNGLRKGVPYVAGKNKVAACAKHFVGDGGTTKGINENNTLTSMHGLLSIHMPAYYDSIIKGVSTVMVSYSSWNGQKMHANRELITGFLKGTLKFKIMVPYNFTEFINDLTYLVKNNFISMDRIDDAVGRILLVKFNLGLFENPLADLSLVNEVGSQAHRDLAREAVRKSLVLLKNGKSANDSLLPLPKKASKNSSCCSWRAPYTETAGDSQTLTMVDPGPDIINNVCGAVKCVVIVISGRPIVMEPYMSTIDALVAAWLPGTEGLGVTDVLFGDYGFTGKLPRTWFKTIDQLPLNVGDSHYDPLFPFGFGLTTKTMVARSISAGVRRAPYVPIVMVFLFVGLYFQVLILRMQIPSGARGVGRALPPTPPPYSLDDLRGTLEVDGGRPRPLSARPNGQDTL